MGGRFWMGLVLAVGQFAESLDADRQTVYCMCFD
jgi:hypothetical protein